MSTWSKVPFGDVTLRGLGVLGVRLIALYFISQSVVYVPAMFTTSPTYPSLVLLAVGLLLWLGVNPIVSRMLPSRRGATADPVGLGNGSLEAVAFALLGLFIVARSLPAFVSASINSWQTANLDWIDLASDGAPVLLGLLIFTGAHGLTRLIIWLRRAGHSG